MIPPVVWQSLSTNTATNGMINFVVSGTAANPTRFYRAVVIVP